VTNQSADTLSVTHIPASSSNRDLNAILGGNGDLVPLALQTTLSQELGTELNHNTENSGNISYIAQESS
jgi:hypothetical protein